MRGPYRETRDTLTELLTLAQAQEHEQAASDANRTVRTRALFALGHLDMRQDDRVAAELRYQEALAASRELGDRRGEAIALFAIGHVVRVRGEYEAARRRFEQARELFEALDDRYWLAQTHQELGVASFYQGDLATARVRYEASLTIYKALGDEPGIVGALEDLGEVAFQEGDLERARPLLRASLEMARRIDDKERIAMVMMTLAGIAVAEGQPRRALRLAAAASGLNDSTGQRNSPAWNAMVDRWLAPASQALSADDVAAVQAAGRVMPLDEAIEYALSSAHEAFDAPASRAGGPVPPAPVSLPEHAGRALRNGSAALSPAPTGPAAMGRAGRAALAGGLRADAEGAGGRGAGRPWDDQSPDRGDADHHRGHRRQPRQAHPGTPGPRLTGPDRRLGDRARSDPPGVGLTRRQAARARSVRS